MTINPPKIQFKWLYNPYFLIFGRDKIDEEEKDLPGLFSHYLRGPILDMEDHFCESFKHWRLQKRIYPFFKESLGLIFNDRVPILTMTFFLSVVIAANESLRLAFYQCFSGQVPAFTQFLLNVIKIGPIDKKKQLIIQDCMLDINAQNTIPDTGLTGFFAIDFSENGQVDTDTLAEIIKWFKLLEKFCTSERLYFHFVPLTQTPMQNHSRQSLLAFNQPILNFSIDPFINRNPKLKENYLLLNEALQAWLINSATYNNLAEYQSFKNDPSTFLTHNPSNEEYQLIEKLFDFMIHCNKENLEH